MSNNKPLPEVDLSLISTPELVNELLSRFDHVIIAGMNVFSYQGNVPMMVSTWYNGNSHTCAGLALEASSTVLKASTIRKAKG